MIRSQPSLAWLLGKYVTSRRWNWVLAYIIFCCGGVFGGWRTLGGQEDGNEKEDKLQADPDILFHHHHILVSSRERQDARIAGSHNYERSCYKKRRIHRCEESVDDKTSEVDLLRTIHTKRHQMNTFSLPAKLAKPGHPQMDHVYGGEGKYNTTRSSRSVADPGLIRVAVVQ